MKLICRSLACLVILFGLISCDNEPIGESGGNGTAPQNAQFKVDINGTTFYANISGMLTQDGKTQIVAKRNDGSKIHIQVQGDGVGNYILNGTPDGNASYQDGEGNNYNMANVDTVGVLHITKYDVVNGLASGAFHFPASLVGIDTTGNLPLTVTADSTGNGNPVQPPNGALEFTNGVFTNISLSSDVAPPPNTQQGSIEVDLDSTHYSTSTAHGVLSPGGMMLINSTDGSSQVAITITDVHEGDFVLSDEIGGEAMVTYNFISDGQLQVNESTQGSLTVTEFDEINHVISGTFSGTLDDTENPGNPITMTNGVFDQVPYTVPNNATTDSVTAQIGDIDFSSDNVAVTGLGNGLVGVLAVDQQNHQLQITIPGDILTGTYPISDEGAYSAVYTDENGLQYTTVNNSGTFNVDERDGDVITGSFVFSVRNEAGEIIQVSAGHYHVDLNP